MSSPRRVARRASPGRASSSHPLTDLAGLIDLLARRGALDVLVALEGPSLTERALERRLAHLAPSVVAQRVAELRELGVIEVVPENDDLRLSPRGRRLQGELQRLGQWVRA